MKVAINYANEGYKKAQKINTKTAYKYGKFDKVVEYSREDINKEYLELHKNILCNMRGDGYWIWKPYIIKDALSKLEEGDYLFYCDSGAIFVKSIDYLINALNDSGQDIMLFETPFIEWQWSKSDVLEYFNVSLNTSILHSCQRLGGYILIRKTKYSVTFFDRYFDICHSEDNLLTDILSESDNEKQIIENRHDQSILSILSKLYGLRPFRDPSEYGKHPKAYKSFMDYMSPDKNILYQFNDYSNSDYPQIIWGHRSGTVKPTALALSWCRSFLPDWLTKRILKLSIDLYRRKSRRQ